MKDYNDNDVRFIRGMIPHHEMAIRMASTEIVYGSNPWAKQLAFSIKAAQKAEIDQMRAWLSQRGLSESGGAGIRCSCLFGIR